MELHDPVFIFLYTPGFKIFSYNLLQKTTNLTKRICNYGKNSYPLDTFIDK